jgi:hypothetical protein
VVQGCLGIELLQPISVLSVNTQYGIHFKVSLDNEKPEEVKEGEGAPSPPSSKKCPIEVDVVETGEVVLDT